jgi:tetratricopeptide (TPR) repeat protein
MTLPPGTRLGLYEIIGPLGAGGMGEVHLARDERLGRRVAIKVLPPHLLSDSIARERLRREALASASLDHPFICKVFEIGESGGFEYIVMEYLEGQTLHQRVASGALPFAECLRISGEIADAIEAAHTGRFVHRDLKPSNIMLTPQGHIKVMDFGLALRVVGAGEETVGAGGSVPALTACGTRVGTLDYMSPEQALGDSLDERSDLFSFGVLMAELLTGAHPFRRGTVESTLTAIIREAPRLGPGVAGLPPAMTGILRRLLAKLPADRYQSITEVRRDLAMMSGVASVPVMPAATAGGRGSTRFPLVGRDHERVDLLAGLAAAAAGRGSLVLIAGEPGIGKTRLTADMLAEAQRRGVFCLVGHCYEMEGAPPYVPFVEMLEYGARKVKPAAFRQALGDAASGVSKLMPELRRMFADIPDPPDLPPEQQRRFLFNAHLAFVERCCQIAPMLVVVEDLQWADEPTLMLLQHVVAAIRSMPLLIIGTYRDVELSATRPFARTLEALLRERRATRITLRRLPGEAVEAMLTSMSGRTPPPLLARVVFDYTEGNPFFVEEVFQHLAEEGKLFDDSGGWRRDLGVRSLDVPESVRLVVGRRLHRLGDAARAVLTTAAVIGRTFSLRLLETIHPDPDIALDAIEEAERARLLVAEPQGREARYRFAHELIRQTLAESLSLPRRQRLHARIADAIERVSAASPEQQASALAHHLYQAGAAADAERTTKYLMLAAAQARAASGFEEALTHLDNALSLWDGDRNASVAAVLVERGGVLLSLGRAHEGMVVLQQAVDLYDALGDVGSMVTASVRLAGAMAWHARHREVWPVTSRALARLGGADAALRCRLLLFNALADAGSGEHPERALEAMPEVAALQRTVDDPALAQECVAIESHLHYEALHLQRAAELGRRAGALARAQGNLWNAVNIEWVPAVAEFYGGHLAEGVRAFTDLLADAERGGHLSVAWLCRSYLAVGHLFAGDLAAAQRAAEEAREFAAMIGTPWIFFDDHLLGIIAHRLDRADDAIRYMRAALAAEPPTFWSGVSRAYLFYLLAFEEDETALSVLQEVPLAIPVPGQAAPAGSWLALPPIVRGLTLLGRTDHVATLHPAMETLVGSGLVVHYTLAETDAGIAAAAAGNWVAAENHHRRAISQAEAMPFPIGQADAREWYADMLLARNRTSDADRARSLLVDAVTLYSALGMTSYARRAGSRVGCL